MSRLDEYRNGELTHAPDLTCLGWMCGFQTDGDFGIKSAPRIPLQIETIGNSDAQSRLTKRRGKIDRHFGPPARSVPTGAEGAL